MAPFQLLGLQRAASRVAVSARSRARPFRRSGPGEPNRITLRPTGDDVAISRGCEAVMSSACGPLVPLVPFPGRCGPAACGLPEF